MYVLRVPSTHAPRGAATASVDIANSTTNSVIIRFITDLSPCKLDLSEYMGGRIAGCGEMEQRSNVCPVTLEIVIGLAVNARLGIMCRSTLTFDVLISSHSQ